MNEKLSPQEAELNERTVQSGLEQILKGLVYVNEGTGAPELSIKILEDQEIIQDEPQVE